MRIMDLILNRRTVHLYTNKSVPDDIIENAIACAVHAPNHKKIWPWKFYRTGEKSRKELGELSARLKASKDKKEISEKDIEISVKKFLEPSDLIVLGQVQCESEFQKKEDYASVACAVQNMSLYLWDAGFGSKWSTGEVTRHAKTYDIMKIDPQQIEICGFLWIGEARTIPEKPARPDIQRFIESRE